MNFRIPSKIVCAQPVFLALAVALLLSAGCAGGPRAGGSQHVPAAPSSPALAADPQIVSGRLDNGLAFYLRQNEEPKDRLYLHLVVKAGSLDESEAERGAAHFLEHMAFRGTKSFPDNGIVRFMESIGMEFGAEVNAHTGYDSTVYDLEIPSKDPEILKRALAVLRDWADGIVIDQAAVDKERGVVLEEERLGRGAGDRVWRQHLPAVYGDSLYGIRDPIGTPESIRAQDAASLRAFYERWYRPELMAVIIVGDAPTETLRAGLSEAFSGLTPRGGPATSPRSLPSRPGLRASVAADPELSSSSLELAARIPLLRSRTEADFVSNGRLNVAIDALGARFSEVVRRSGGAEISSAEFDTMELADDCLVLYGDVSFKGGDWRSAARAFTSELGRIADHGYSAEELSRIRKDYFADFERARTNGYDSRDWSSRLERAFIAGTVPISVDERIRLYRLVFDGLKPKDCSGYATLLTAPEEGLELLSIPSSTASPPSPAELKAALASPPPSLGPWVSEAAPTAILQDGTVSPVASLVAEDKAAGATILSYPNGLRVILRKTDLKADEIALAGVAMRGSNWLDDEGFRNVVIAPNLIPGSGFPGISPDALASLVSGKTLSLSARVGTGTVFLRGSSGGKDLKSLLELVHRTMTDPVVDPGYFKAVQTQLAEYGKSFPTKPENLLSLAMASSLFPDNGRMTLFSREEDAAALRAEAVEAGFRSLFGSAEGFVFCLSGSFDPEAVKMLCDTYLGSLPRGQFPPKPAHQESLSAKASSQRVKAGKEDKAQVIMVFKTPESETDPRTIDGLDVVAEALSRRLMERIRNLKGAAYDVNAFALTNDVSAYSYISVSFGCAPDRIEELEAVVLEEAAGLARAGVEPGALKEIVLAFKKDLQKSAGQNSFWANELSLALARGQGLVVLQDKESRLDSLDVEWTKKAATAYLDPARLASFTLVPVDR